MTKLKKSHQNSRPRKASVRIISGKWRRRTLPVGDAPGLRPTGDRIRETLFNWLLPHIHGARCLDLFAGTGALGLEALSRGAKHVQFIEKDRATAQQLKSNLAVLQCPASDCSVYHGDANHWLAQSTTSTKLYDLAFLDPPFAANLWQVHIDVLSTHPLLAKDALIYVESPIETKLALPTDWLSVKQLRAGSINAQLFRVNLHPAE